MGLNIKNERVHRLAREAAATSGYSQTRAIEEALKRYLAELGAVPRRASSQAAVEHILADLDRRLTDEARAALTCEDLYDDAGLPR
jgi:antitoxin VapB